MAQMYFSTINDQRPLDIFRKWFDIYLKNSEANNKLLSSTKSEPFVDVVHPSKLSQASLLELPDFWTGVKISNHQLGQVSAYASTRQYVSARAIDPNEKTPLWGVLKYLGQKITSNNPHSHGYFWKMAGQLRELSRAI